MFIRLLCSALVYCRTALYTVWMPRRFRSAHIPFANQGRYARPLHGSHTSMTVRYVTKVDLNIFTLPRLLRRILRVQQMRDSKDFNQNITQRASSLFLRSFDDNDATFLLFSRTISERIHSHGTPNSVDRKGNCYEVLF